MTSRLDYCNSLLAGQPMQLLNRFQSVQNSAARLFSGLTKTSHVTSTLRDELHWLRIPQRIKFKICTLVFRCLHGQAPSYLSDYCIKLQDSDSRTSRNRSAAKGNLFIPRSRTATYGKRSFRVCGPTFWNALSSHLKADDISYATFKTHLKSYLFNESYF